MTALSEIERALASGGDLNDIYDALQVMLKVEPDNSAVWYLLGGVFRRKQQWQDAISAYNRAKMLDPEGPADAAIESIYDMIRFSGNELVSQG